MSTVTVRRILKNRITGETLEYPTDSPRTYTAIDESLKFRSPKGNSGSFIPGTYKVTELEQWTYTYLGSGFSRQRSQDPKTGVWLNNVSISGDVLAPALSFAHATFPFPDTATLRKEALLKAYSGVGEASMQLNEDLAEISSLLEQLKSPAKALREGLKKAVAKPRKAPGALLGGTAGSILEFNLGWKPLVGTIETIMELLNKKLAAWDPMKIRRSKGKVSQELESRASTQFIHYYMNRFEPQGMVYDKVTVRAVVHFRMEAPQSLADSMGLTPRHMPELAWNLTKASWLADYFLSIGDYLGTLRYNPGITILGNTVSVKVDRHIKLSAHHATATDYPSYLDTQYNAVEAGIDCQYYRRYINQEVPKFPVLRASSLNVTKLLNTFAYAGILAGNAAKKFK